jgi:aminobenzoyl-glutamate utilization protein B
VKTTFARVVKAAEAAALGTETTMEYEVIHGIYNVLPNMTLQEAMHANLERVGGVTYDETELRFARIIRRSLPEDAPPLESAREIRPLTISERGSGGSTDVADVSWAVATGGMRAATWVPGTISHSWQAVAAGGTTIGEKGMVVAAKTLAMTAVDLFTDPSLVERARAEHRERIPAGWVYEPLLGDRDPPLDYRLPARSGAN